MRQGNYENSLALLKAELPGEFTRSESAVWRKLTQASSLTYMSRLDEAKRALAEAQSLASSFQPQLLGEVFLRQGTLASVQENMPEAQSHFRASLQFARSHQDPFLEASALGSLGVSAERMEHHDESIDWNKRALALIRANSWLGLAAKAEGNLAWSYFQLGDYEQALAQYQIAEEYSVRAGLEHEQVLWLTSLADTNYALEDYPAAQSQAQQALRLALKLGDPADIINCRQDSALIALETGQLAEARAHLQESERILASAPDPAGEIYNRLLSANLRLRARDFAAAVDSYSSIIGTSAASGPIRWEARAGLAQAHSALGENRLAEREFRETIAEFSRARREITEDNRLSFLAIAIRFYDAYVNFLVEQRRPSDALQIAELGRAQTLEDGLSEVEGRRLEPHRNVNPQAIAARLRATILFYWLGSQKSWLWAITPSTISITPLPARRELRNMVDSYRKSFIDDPRDPLETNNSEGRKLYALLVQPVEKLIPKNGRVFILPDHGLNTLNFETLISQSCPGKCSDSAPQAHYWIDDVILANASSLSLLNRAAVLAPPKSPNLFLVGNPLFASSDFPQLAQADKEIGLLEKQFPSRLFALTGAKATATEYFNSHPENFSYVHFTAHGTASRLQPLDSAIILSPEADSFKLYARDILRHPLSAYLVTISACNGAGTRTYAGEGLVGLSWAFLRAGAHNVIAGLWEVSNASTPQLMDQMYKNLLSGQDPAAALRNAKLTLVHSSGNYRRPFYWAPFLVYSGS
jgi:CHAT domain-containing protein